MAQAQSAARPAQPRTGRLGAAVLRSVDDRLAGTDQLLAGSYPGDPGTRQPVHTVYVPADQVSAASTAEWGAAAIDLLATVLPDAATAAAVTGLGAIVDELVYDRTRAKLRSQPVEDLRVDFEDGYGARPDDEEDATAVAVGALLARVLESPSGPSFGGIRFKSLEAATRARGLRTLDLVIDALLGAGPLPAGFVVTLPKVTTVDQVAAMCEIVAVLEQAHGLVDGALRFEIQIETPQAIVGADGTAPVARMVHTAGARCVGLHYGTFDYSAACGIAAPFQSLEHPVADHAKAVMQVAAAGTGVRLCDGSTNVLPVGTPEQVRDALRLHARLVRRSLERGYYQGWDMHPGHLVTRYLATYSFYREGLPAAATRLRNYLARTAGGVMDEPATAQALASFVLRGLHCGALDEADVLAETGSTDLDRRSLDALARRLPLDDSETR